MAPAGTQGTGVGAVLMVAHGVIGLGAGWGISRLADRELGLRQAPQLRPTQTSLTVLVTAILFVAFGALLPMGAGARFWADSLVLIAYWFCTGFSVLLSVIDFRTHILPNRFVLPAIAMTAVLLAAATFSAGEGWESYWQAIASGSAAYGLLFILCIVGGLGFGDVKLGAILGAYCGWLSWGAAAMGLVLAFLLGGLVSLMLVLSRRATRKSSVPFGPWLCLGALLAMLATLAFAP